MVSRCITIYTDASFCAKTKIGGWACWIKAAPGETALRSGAFKMPVSSVDDAELRAIVNGITAAVKLFDTTQKIIVVVTDSQHAIGWINKVRNRTTAEPGHKRKKLDANMFRLAKMVWEAVPVGCELRVNKVKAHSNADGARSYVNNVVDEACRDAMRRARAGRVEF